MPPSDRITIGAIGVGSRGTADLRSFLAQRDARGQAARAAIRRHGAIFQFDMGIAPGTRVNSQYALMKDFLDCVKSRHRPVTGIAQAFSADVACIIAAMAVRLETPLQWDIEQERFLNNETANRMRSRPMRSPWQV